MPRKKPISISITEEEKEQYNIGENYLDSRRSDNGFIQISLSPKGASILNNKIENDIEKKIKELDELRKQRSHYEDIQESVSKKDKKKMKKEKKKKKKEKKKLKNVPESTKILFGAIEEYKDKFHNGKKKKKDKFDGITSKEKGTTKKQELTDEEKEQRKAEKEKKEFDKKFEEPLALIRENLIDMTQSLIEIDEMIKETKESRARSKHIMLKDLITTKTSLFAARATSARAIADIQKTRLDIELKKTKESGNVDEKTKNIAMMNKFFPQLIANGSLNSKLSNKSKDDDDDDYKQSKKDKKKKKIKYPEDDDNFDKHVSKLIKSGDIELSPHEAAIDMEGKYTVQIMYSYKDPNEWKPIAVDNHGKIIKNFKDQYPGLLPKRKDLDLKIDTEKDIAKCKRTDQVFSCIGVPYLY